MITIIKDNLIQGCYCRIDDGQARYCMLGTVFHALDVPDHILKTGQSYTIAAALPADMRAKFFDITQGAAATILTRPAQLVVDLNDSDHFEEAYYALKALGVDCEFVDKGRVV